MALPTELLQSILLTTPYETFAHARLVNRRWYHAASTAYILRKALEQTPTPLPPLHSLSENAWNDLFDQVTRLSLLRYWTRGPSKSVSNRRLPRGCTPAMPSVSSRDGRRVAVLDGTKITVHDLDGDAIYGFNLAHTLYPLLDTLTQHGLNQGFARYRLAISSRASLVAISIGKIIQIYDYRDPASLGFPAEYVLGQLGTSIFTSLSHPGPNYLDTDGVVEGLEFADDHEGLLRVVIGKEASANRISRVQYLGDPSLVSSTSGKACLDYWRKSLNKVYLDSVALATNLPNNDYKTVFKGLRLLPRSYPEHNNTTTSRSVIAALQTQDTQEYCIASIPPTPTPTPAPSSNAQPPITITRHLPSQPTTTSPPTPSSTPLPLPPTINNNKSTTTQNLLSASQSRFVPLHLPPLTAQNPLITVSDDARLLAVYEAGAGHSCRYLSGGAVFVYCLDGPVDDGVDADACMHGADGGDGVNGGSGDAGAGGVLPWSYLVDIVDVDVEGVRIVGADGEYTVVALAGQQVIQWRL